MSSSDTRTGQEFSLLLDDQLCFALYAASRAVTSRYRPLLESLGLTYPQYLVLLVLWEHDTVPVKEIGAALQLDYGTLTPMIKRLESAGLVRRERRPDDERTVLVTLTQQGQELREQARTIPTDIGNAMGLTPSQFEQARALLRLLAANISASA
jgi:DNA-binding MarR family transcriptional regulator